MNVAKVRHEGCQRLAHKFCRFVAEDPAERRVGEQKLALVVNPGDPVADGFRNCPKTFLDVAPGFLRSSLLSNVKYHAAYENRRASLVDDRKHADQGIMEPFFLRE